LFLGTFSAIFLSDTWRESSNRPRHKHTRHSRLKKSADFQDRASRRFLDEEGAFVKRIQAVAARTGKSRPGMTAGATAKFDEYKNRLLPLLNASFFSVSLFRHQDVFADSEGSLEA
jgi:hypothetical protein